MLPGIVVVCCSIALSYCVGCCAALFQEQQASRCIGSVATLEGVVCSMCIASPTLTSKPRHPTTGRMHDRMHGRMLSRDACCGLKGSGNRATEQGRRCPWLYLIALEFKLWLRRLKVNGSYLHLFLTSQCRDMLPHPTELVLICCFQSVSC